MDWEKALDYLETCEKVYTGIGRSGLLALALTIAPLRDRFNRGERTQELYDEIFEIEV